MGEKWQGPSGRWFTVNSDGRVVPAAGPGGDDGATAGGRLPDSLDGLHVLKNLGGSTGARLVSDADGNEFVMKSAGRASAAHLRNEAAADAAYRALGVATPESRLYETGDGVVKLGAFEQGVPLGTYLDGASPEEKERAVKELQKGFVADALLRNWDVIGTDRSNVLVTPPDGVLRVDNGGALGYRARGAPKPAAKAEVTELDSMRDPEVNPSAAAIFGGVSDEEIREQIGAIAARREELLAALPEDQRPAMASRLDWLVRTGGKAPPPAPRPGLLGRVAGAIRGMFGGASEPEADLPDKPPYEGKYFKDPVADSETVRGFLSGEKEYVLAGGGGGGGFNDTFLQDVMNESGRGRPPAVHDGAGIDELAKKGWQPAYRACGSPEYNAQWKGGDNYCGSGSFGNGHYVATVNPQSDDLTSWKETRTYAGSGGTMRLAIPPNARRIKFSEIRAGQKATRKQFDAMLKAGKIDRAQHRKLNDVIDDPGRWAALNNYDVIDVDRTKNFSVILNRSICAAQKDDAPRPEQR